MHYIIVVLQIKAVQFSSMVKKMTKINKKESEEFFLF